MSSKSSSSTPTSTSISPEELEQILLFLFVVTHKPMLAQLIGVALINQASAADLLAAIECLKDVLPSNTDEDNRQILVQNAPALEIVARYSSRLAGKREHVLPGSVTPLEKVVKTLLRQYRAWKLEEFARLRKFAAAS